MTSCKVAFLKSKIPEGCVNPICIIDDPGFATLIAFCLVNSRPTVSNIISKEFSSISLSSGLTDFEFKLSEHTLSLF